MAEESTFRLFVAVLTPDIVKAAIAAAQNELRASLPAHSVGWTRPEQFHLTLKFLGAVPATDADALAQALDAVSAGFGPLQFRAVGVGFFPSPNRPRVIWAGLEETTGQLQDLHEAIEKATQPFTREQPENRFHAHVTIGRVKQAGRHEASLMADWAQRQSGKEYGDWKADSFALVKSQLSSTGAIHIPIHSTPLSAPGKTGLPAS